MFLKFCLIINLNGTDKFAYKLQKDIPDILSGRKDNANEDENQPPAKLAQVIKCYMCPFPGDKKM